MLTLDDVKKVINQVDEFRQVNANIVVTIDTLPEAINRRDRIENRIRDLFFDLRDQICKDNDFSKHTPISTMQDSSIISKATEIKLFALLDYIKSC